MAQIRNMSVLDYHKKILAKSRFVYTRFIFIVLLKYIFACLSKPQYSNSMYSYVLTICAFDHLCGLFWIRIYLDRLDVTVNAVAVYVCRCFAQVIANLAFK